MVLADIIKGHIAFVPLRVTMLPGAADDRLEPVSVRAADGVMDRNDTAAALEELFEVGAVVAGDGTGLGGEHDQDIGVVELGAGGKLHRAIDFGAAVREELLPVLEPAFVIMEAVAGRAMGLRAAAKEDAEGLICGKS